MGSFFVQMIEISRSGLISHMEDLDNVSHNFSNVNTNGFKQIRTNFQEMLDRQLMNGVYPTSSQRWNQQGVFEQTTSPLDLAVSGEGYFGIRLPDGRTAYTRDGHFSLDAQNRIVAANGYPLVWTGGQIPAEAEEINVSQDGAVRYRVGQTWTQAGTISLYRTPNLSGMISYGQNLWLESEASGAVQTGTPGTNNFGQIINGTLEKSNVDVAGETTHMVVLQRAFDMSMRMLKQTDAMIGEAIQMRQ